MKINIRNKISTVVIAIYSLYLYLVGLSLRNTSKVMEQFSDRKRSSFLHEIGYTVLDLLYLQKSFCIHIDKTIIQIGNENWWL